MRVGAWIGEPGVHRWPAGRCKGSIYREHCGGSSSGEELPALRGRLSQGRGGGGVLPPPASLHCKPSQQLVEAPRHTNTRRVSSAHRREVEKLPILDEKHCATQSKQSILLLVFNQKELIPARVHTSFKDKKGLQVICLK